MARRGRPPKPAAERLAVILRHRLSREEYRNLRAAAKHAGLPLSAYIRRKLLGS